MDMMHVNDDSATALLTYIGQFIMHDITDTKEGIEPYPITIPYCDFNFDQQTCNLGDDGDYPDKKTLDFYRSDYEIKNGHREQVYLITFF